MSRKINTDWFSPTEEMVEQINHRGSNLSYWRLSLDKVNSHFKFQMEYEGKKMTGHWTSLVDVSNDKSAVTLCWPKTKEEMKDWQIDYDKNHVKVSYSEFMTKAKFRIVGADKYNAIVDDLEVGDFVQFSTQRDKKSWRKIMTIDWDNMKIFGWKYSEPIDDPKYDCRYSSENTIYEVIKLVKKGNAHV